jgi:hypothetical protein
MGVIEASADGFKASLAEFTALEERGEYFFCSAPAAGAIKAS